MPYHPLELARGLDEAAVAKVAHGRRAAQVEDAVDEVGERPRERRAGGGVRVAAAEEHARAEVPAGALATDDEAIAAKL